MKYPAYPKYKSSGVEWLGDVPEHWDVVPLKQVTNFVNGMAFKPDDWSPEGVPIIRIENLNGGTDFNGFDGEVARRYHITKGDLLFGWSGNRGTSFGPFLWWRDGTHYLNQHIFKLIGFACEKGWFYWTLKAVTRTIEDEAHGIIGMVHVTRGRLGAIKMPMIPRLEQRGIAQFLHAKMDGLDNLLTQKLALIEKLKEKRTALISRVVTRGLPPEAARAAGLCAKPRLKPSGIEWLGEVPEHWEVKRVKHLGRIRYGLGEPPDYVEDGLAFIRATDIQRGKIDLESVKKVSPHDIPWSRNPTLKLHEILVVRSGAYTGDSAIVTGEIAGCIAGYDMVLTAAAGHPPFVAWVLLSKYMLQSQIYIERLRAAQPHLNAEELGGFVILVPTISEQRAIADYLDRETTKIDRMVAKVEAAIERLREYRTALITAAVTGKIDVRPKD